MPISSIVHGLPSSQLGGVSHTPLIHIWLPPAQGVKLGELFLTHRLLSPQNVSMHGFASAQSSSFPHQSAGWAESVSVSVVSPSVVVSVSVSPSTMMAP